MPTVQQEFKHYLAQYLGSVQAGQATDEILPLLKTSFQTLVNAQVINPAALKPQYLFLLNI